MGFEEKVERSFGRPCRSCRQVQADMRTRGRNSLVTRLLLGKKSGYLYGQSENDADGLAYYLDREPHTDSTLCARLSIKRSCRCVRAWLSWQHLSGHGRGSDASR
jgi:hypothetical protein